MFAKVVVGRQDRWNIAFCHRVLQNGKKKNILRLYVKQRELEAFKRDHSSVDLHQDGPLKAGSVDGILGNR